MTHEFDSTIDDTWSPEVLREAGVRASHIAEAFGIHKLTAANWLMGRRAPHRLLGDRPNRFMRAVRQALEQGDLPVARADDPTAEVLRKYWPGDGSEVTTSA